MSFSSDKKLFTPGPLGCSRSVKEAMLRDLGSRDAEFVDTVKQVRQKLLDIAGVRSEDYASILLQGSGTFSVEAVLQTTAPRNKAKVLLLVNGAYGKRMKMICDKSNISSDVLEFAENETVSIKKVDEHLRATRHSYSTIAVVHCETSSGIINPIAEIGQLVKLHQEDAVYFVDAMSSFGAVPINFYDSRIDFLVSSANKCLQGVPGFAFVIANKQQLVQCRKNCSSLSLDIVDQYDGLEGNGQFRFTPPTHTLLAFLQALKEYEQEGGLEGRSKRYRKNCDILQEGMKKMGFKKLLSDENEGYIITSYHYPSHINFTFQEFYTRLNNLGQVIYPGKVTNADCFRIGNIGDLHPHDMEHLLKCIEQVMHEMDIPIPIK